MSIPKYIKKNKPIHFYRYAPKEYLIWKLRCSIFMDRNICYLKSVNTLQVHSKIYFISFKRNGEFNSEDFIGLIINFLWKKVNVWELSRFARWRRSEIGALLSKINWTSKRPATISVSAVHKPLKYLGFQLFLEFCEPINTTICDVSSNCSFISYNQYHLY